MAGYLRGLLIVTVQRGLAVLRLKRVDMNRSIGRLRGDILVQRVPGNTLDIMTVFGNLSYQGVRGDVVYAGDVIHTSNDEVVRIG